MTGKRVSKWQARSMCIALRLTYRKVAAQHLVHAQLKTFDHQRMADRHFQDAGNIQETRQVVQIGVVPGIHAQAHRLCPPRRLQIRFKYGIASLAAITLGKRSVYSSTRAAPTSRAHSSAG